jgi:hypothetical protein
VTGTEGIATSPAFAVPHMDNRVVVARKGHTTEVCGDQSSYTYQLAHLADSIQGGRQDVTSIDAAVANAELVDECYRRAGLSPRPVDTATARDG